MEHLKQAGELETVGGRAAIDLLAGSVPAVGNVRQYARIVRTCHAAFIRPIAVGMPLPTLAIERRSPGFRRSTSLFNGLIRDALPESFCDVEQQMTEAVRDVCLLEDGHHLTETGPRLYAEALLALVQKNL